MVIIVLKKRLGKFLWSNNITFIEHFNLSYLYHEIILEVLSRYTTQLQRKQFNHKISDCYHGTQHLSLVRWRDHIRYIINSFHQIFPISPSNGLLWTLAASTMSPPPSLSPPQPFTRYQIINRLLLPYTSHLSCAQYTTLICQLFDKRDHITYIINLYRQIFLLLPCG